MHRVIVWASALSLASAAYADQVVLPAPMRVLPNYNNLVFVGEAGGMGGKVAGYYVDPTTLQRTANGGSIQATQYIAAGAVVAGRQLAFVQMRFYYDCTQMTYNFGNFIAMDSNGTIVDRQDAVSGVNAIPNQNTIQYAIRRYVCQ